ncbi:unnamed protein product [Ophioblennius macclurei]
MKNVQALGDLPEYEVMEDEGFPPLPPPGSPGQGGQDDDGDGFDNGDEADLSKLAEVPAAKRKGVKRPQPKLDSQRLISDRGLPALRSLFQDVTFKGKGHEEENLRLLMQKMENWAHRLFPKLRFEDFMDKVEKLGAKKEVQTCLKRIRLDMPLTHDDFTGEEAELLEQPPPEDLDPFAGLLHSTPAPTPAPVQAPPLAEAPPSLTEEQRSRMEESRRRALERRRTAHQQLPDLPHSQSVESNLQPTSPPTTEVLQTNGEEQRVEEEEKEEEVLEKVVEVEEEEEETMHEENEEEKKVEKENNEEEVVVLEETAEVEEKEEKKEEEVVLEETVEVSREEEKVETMHLDKVEEEPPADSEAPTEEQTGGAS